MIFSKLAARSSLLASVLRREMSGKAGHGKGDHEATANLWKRIFYFVACPALIISMINTYLAEKEHWGHYHRPPFKPYEYMRIRTSKFPWGDGNRSLFHNPLVNPLPTGWEPLPDHLKKYDVLPEGEQGGHHH